MKTNKTTKASKQARREVAAKKLAKIIKAGSKLVLVKASNAKVVYAPRANRPGVIDKLQSYATKKGLTISNLRTAAAKLAAKDAAPAAA